MCCEKYPPCVDSISCSSYLFISCTVCVVIGVSHHYGHCTWSLAFFLLCPCRVGVRVGEAGGGPGLQGDKVQANGRKSLKFAVAAFHVSTEGPPLAMDPYFDPLFSLSLSRSGSVSLLASLYFFHPSTRVAELLVN